MEAAADDRLTVLYLIAKGRSGSNILAHFLGQLDSYCNTGELHHLWKWGLQESRRCGCGRTVPECELWSRVVRILPVRIQQPSRPGRRRSSPGEPCRAFSA